MTVPMKNMGVRLASPRKKSATTESGIMVERPRVASSGEVITTASARSMSGSTVESSALIATASSAPRVGGSSNSSTPL